MRRIGFAVLLSVVSMYFAECTITNESILGHPIQSALLTIPLYGLHALILGRIAFRRGTPAFPTLFLCGMLFGLYEAYITKIIWTGWDANDRLRLSGVSVIAMLVLVPWWHAFMAFMLPLVFVERYALGWREETALLPKRIREWLESPRHARSMWAGLGVFYGCYQAAAGLANPLAPFLGLGDLLVMLALVHFWRAKEGETLQSMLPTGRGFKVAVAWLVGLYGLSIVAFRPEKLPALGPQLVILGFYAAFILLLVRSFRPQAIPESGAVHPRVAVLPEVAPFAVTWFVTALVVRHVPMMPVVMFLVCTLTGILIGLWCFGKTMRSVLGRATPPPPALNFEI